MSVILEWDRDIVQRITRLEQRRIEGFAVVGHQSLAGSQEVGQGFEQGRFLAGITHEELQQAEGPA